MNTFKLISKTLLFSAVLSLTGTFVSCEEIGSDTWERPNDMSSYIPDYSMKLAGSWSLTGNVVSFNLKPQVFADFDYWQLKIKSIDYYIDDTFIKTDTNEPYSFVYTMPMLSAGQHRLVAKVTIEDLVNHGEIVISPIKAFEVKSSSQPDTSDGLAYNATWYESGNNVYFDIDNIRIWSSLADSGWTLTSVSFYLDNELIDIINEEPFCFTYIARDLSEGKHYFYIKGEIVNALNGNKMELVRKIEFDIP